MLRTAHLEQDEAIRQDNRQKAQQQKATIGLGGQGSGPNGQASPIVAELQRESDEANRQDSLQKAQEQKVQDEASREESLQRAQAVVSPFTRATVHRQIGVLLFMSAVTSQQIVLCKQVATTFSIAAPPFSLCLADKALSFSIPCMSFAESLSSNHYKSGKCHKLVQFVHWASEHQQLCVMLQAMSTASC